LIEVFLLIRPTPAIGAPPTETPGVPKAPLLPVVCVPPIGVDVPPAPVVAVPPVPVDEPKPLPELGSVPPMGDVDVPLVPKGDPEDPLKGELDDPAPNDEPLPPNDEPLLPNPDPEDPRDELPVPGEDVEEPNGEEEDPNGLEAPVPVPGVAPVGVMPPAGCTVWPNNPCAGTFHSP
jgi:hypothetical protein